MTRKEKRVLLPSQKRRRELLFIGLALLWPITQFIVFWVVPNFNSIVMAFRVPDGETFTLVNFQRFFRELQQPNNPIIPSFWNSIILFVVGTFIQFPLVILLTYVLFKKVYGHKVFRVIFYTPAILGASVTTALYRYLISSNGPVERILDLIGVEYSKQLGLLGNPETVFLMIIIYGFWTGVGTNMIMMLGAMNRVPDEIIDSARIDGVGFWRELFQIILPMIWPTLTTLIVFSMTGIFTNSAATMLLAPDAPEASTIGWYITRFTMSAGSGLTGEILNYPAAVGLIFTAISFPLIMLTKWLCDKITNTVEY